MQQILYHCTLGYNDHV